VSQTMLEIQWTLMFLNKKKIVKFGVHCIFHTLRRKIGIKYFERHLVLKYHDGLHRYIHAKMMFLDISSLGVA
jgi:hypothetical protein